MEFRVEILVSYFQSQFLIKDLLWYFKQSDQTLFWNYLIYSLVESSSKWETIRLLSI